jgi:hypothetical protein
MLKEAPGFRPGLRNEWRWVWAPPSLSLQSRQLVAEGASTVAVRDRENGIYLYKLVEWFKQEFAFGRN